MTKPRYDHQVSIAFTVYSDDKNADDLNADMLRAALLRRIEDLDRHGNLGWLEAVHVEDTYDTHEDDQ